MLDVAIMLVSPARVGIALGLLASTLPACRAETTPEPRAQVTSTLTREVVLPRRLGGGKQKTLRAAHGKARKAYPAGLRPRTPSLQRAGFLRVNETPPESADLSEFAPEPADQGETSSCTSWASGYGLMGWWARKHGVAGAPFAPFFVYSQLVDGDCNLGSDIEMSLEILKTQGIPSDEMYQPMQSQLDCSRHDIDEATQANAAEHRITGYARLDPNDLPGAIKAAIGRGLPVVLGVATFSNFANAGPDSYFVDAPESGDEDLGGHAIAAFAYDDAGVWILNSYSAQWGKDGWGQLSWDYITTSGSYPNEAMAITGIAGGK